MMFKDKKGILIRDYLIAVILFSGIILLMGYAATEWINDYGAGDIIDPSYDSYSKFNERVGDTEQAFSDINPTGEGFKFISASQGILNAFSSITKLVLEGLSDVRSQLIKFGEDYGIPDSVGNVLIDLVFWSLVVIIVFLILSYVGRGSGRL